MHTSPLAPLGLGDGGGMNVYVKELATRLPDVDVSVDIYTATETSRPAVVDLRTGLRVHHIAVGTSSVDDIQERFTAGVARHIERNGGVDLIHAHYWKSGLSGHGLKHHFDVPLVTTFHTLSLVKAAAGIAEIDQERLEAERQIIACSDSIIANDNREAAELHEYYDIDAASEQVRVIAPGVDLKRFHPTSRAKARATLGFDVDRHLVVMAGRVQPIKGFDVGLDALARVRHRFPELQLVLAGAGSGPDGDATMKTLRQIDQRHGTATAFIGAQSSQVMNELFNAADVCLVPSRSESFGLVALEASACGTPVVATNVGALPTVVLDHRTGYVVESENSSAMATAIENVLSRPDDAERLATAAVKHARNFSWDATVGRTYCLYNRVLDNALLSDIEQTCAIA